MNEKSVDDWAEIVLLMVIKLERRFDSMKSDNRVDTYHNAGGTRYRLMKKKIFGGRHLNLHQRISGRASQQAETPQTSI